MNLIYVKELLSRRKINPPYKNQSRKQVMVLIKLSIFINHPKWLTFFHFKPFLSTSSPTKTRANSSTCLSTFTQHRFSSIRRFRMYYEHVLCTSLPYKNQSHKLLQCFPVSFSSRIPKTLSAFTPSRF